MSLGGHVHQHDFQEDTRSAEIPVKWVHAERACVPWSEAASGKKLSQASQQQRQQPQQQQQQLEPPWKVAMRNVQKWCCCREKRFSFQATQGNSWSEADKRIIITNRNFFFKKNRAIHDSHWSMSTLRFLVSMLSRTALKTTLIFSVSTAVVKW